MPLKELIETLSPGVCSSMISGPIDIACIPSTCCLMKLHSNPACIWITFGSRPYVFSKTSFYTLTILPSGFSAHAGNISPKTVSNPCALNMLVTDSATAVISSA